MSQVKEGDTVKVHYTGTFEDGTVFDSSKGREPLDVKIGAGQVIPGFEKGLIGMNMGESRKITLEPVDAYGDYREELTADVPRSQFPENITPEIGQQLQVKQPDGNVVDVAVTRVGDELVTLDANHPLAGKTLNFDVEIVAIG